MGIGPEDVTGKAPEACGSSRDFVALHDDAGSEARRVFADLYRPHLGDNVISWLFSTSSNSEYRASSKRQGEDSTKGSGDKLYGLLVPSDDPPAGIEGVVDEGEADGAMVIPAEVAVADVDVADLAVPTPSNGGNCAAILAPNKGM